MVIILLSVLFARWQRRRWWLWKDIWWQTDTIKPRWENELNTVGNIHDAQLQTTNYAKKPANYSKNLSMWMMLQPRKIGSGAWSVWLTRVLE